MPEILISPDLATKVEVQSREFARELCIRLSARRPVATPWQWVIDNMRFDEPGNRGPFEPRCRQYLEEIINNIDDDDVSDETLCLGTGNAKTTSHMCKLAWAMANDPFRGLYVMPAQEGAGGADEFNGSRLSAAIKVVMPDKFPARTKADRLMIAGSILNFVGSNAPSQVGANRCRIVICDEKDKFKSVLVRDERTGEYREAGAGYLANERTKQVARAHRIGSSTPTTESGPIWKDLMASDLRRRWVPCWSCKQKFVLVKDRQYTVLPDKLDDGTVIPMANLKWDAEAARKDGSIDYDRLVRSARFECPHCGHQHQDNRREWMDANGMWVPTYPSVKRHRGYHLPSFYAPQIAGDFDTSWGGMAKKFQNSMEKGEIGGYINSDLAEVNVSQQHQTKEFIEITKTQSVPSDLWLPIASFDHQQNWPYFWYTVRRWLVSVFRPARTTEEQKSFYENLSSEQKTLCEKIQASNPQAAKILETIQLADQWPAVAAGLLAAGRTGAKLCDEFMANQNQHALLERFIPGAARQGDSELIECGFCDTWQDVEDIQKRNDVRANDVIIDARFGERGNHQEVYIEAFMRCPQSGFYHWMPGGAGGRAFQSPMPGTKPVAAMGWTPCEGWQKGKRWRNKMGVGLPYVIDRDDPYKGTVDANRSLIEVFRFDADWALSEMARLRKRNRFTIAPDCLWWPRDGDGRGGAMTRETYQLHLRGYFWSDALGAWDSPAKHGGSQSKSRPNHLYDCEKNGVAYAAEKGIFRYQQEQK